MFFTGVLVAMTVCFYSMLQADFELLNFCLTVASGFAVVLSICASKMPIERQLKYVVGFFAAIYMFIPASLDVVDAEYLRPFIKFNFNSDLHPDIKNKEFLKPIIHHDVHGFTEAMEIMKKADKPVLFKNLMPNSKDVGQRVLNRLVRENKTLNVGVYNVSGEFDFMRGSKFTRAGIAKKQVSEVMRDNSPYFASFEPFLERDEIHEIAGDVVSGKTLFDTNFMSHFNDTVVTAGIHGAAVITSWSLQMMGSKSWFLWSPEESRKMHNSWWARTTLNAWGGELEAYSRPTYKLKVEAGDVLAFPPYWMHAVITHPGPNLMLNLRTNIGWVPFGGDFLCGARIAVSFPFIALFKFVPALLAGEPLPKSNPLVVNGIRNIKVQDSDAAYKTDAHRMRLPPVDQFL